MTDMEIMVKIYHLMASFEREAATLSEAVDQSLVEKIQEQLEGAYMAESVFDSIRWGLLDVIEDIAGDEEKYQELISGNFVVTITEKEVNNV
jgi:hypothetical protein